MSLFLMVVFVVLMCLWLFGGGYFVYSGPGGWNPVAFGTGTFIPWLCVGILGYLVFTGGVPTTAPPR
jgi:hypothetical protein